MFNVCISYKNSFNHNISYFLGILTIEALRDCVNLTHLNLEGNSIKTIEHLSNNTKLEVLNLGENSIGIISDISFLKQLKVSELKLMVVDFLHIFVLIVKLLKFHAWLIFYA